MTDLKIEKCVMCRRTALFKAKTTGEPLCTGCMEIDEEILKQRKNEMEK